jgi:glycosyltransferase involved in cell wall biosynthesis
MEKMEKSRLTLVLLPVSERGGIQRMTAAALPALLSDGNTSVLRLRGYSVRDKIVFFLQMLVTLPRATAVVSFHLNLLRPAFLFRKKKVVVFTHGIELWRRDFFPDHWEYIVNSRLNYFYLKSMNQRLRVQQHFYPGLECSVKSVAKQKEELFSVLCVSRLSKADAYKGLVLFIDAIRIACARGAAIKAVIAGEGDHREELKQFADGLPVQFCGAVSDEKLAGLYAGSHAFVLPSTHEGQGLVFLEAMSAGLPVIGLKQTVLEELIQHGTHGLLVGPSAESLAEAIMYLASNQVVYESMAAAAKKRSNELQNPDAFRVFVENLVRV